MLGSLAKLSGPVALPKTDVSSLVYNPVDSYVNSAKELMRDERQYNSAEAQKNRDWQEYMSNTSYTRAVEDLRNAGLNPYLAYSQGGAPVTTGATATHNGISSGVTSAYVSNLNTLLNNQTARDNVILQTATSKQIAVMNNITRLVGSVTSALGSFLRFSK